MRWVLSVAMVMVMSVCGCAYFEDWFNNRPPIVIPGTTTTTTIPPVTNPDGFVFGQWTWLGGRPCAPDAVIAPAAQILTAEVEGEYVYNTFGPRAKLDQWWPPYDEACYGYQAMAWFIDGKWWAAYIESYPKTCRGKEEFKNPFKSDTPFAAHPPYYGCSAVWWVQDVTGTKTSTRLQITWK